MLIPFFLYRILPSRDLNSWIDSLRSSRILFGDIEDERRMGLTTYATHTHTYIYIYMYMYIYIYMCVCMYMYMICICYDNIYIYTCM